MITWFRWVVGLFSCKLFGLTSPWFTLLPIVRTQVRLESVVLYFMAYRRRQYEHGLRFGLSPHHFIWLPAVDANMSTDPGSAWGYSILHFLMWVARSTRQVVEESWYGKTTVRLGNGDGAWQRSTPSLPRFGMIPGCTPCLAFEESWGCRQALRCVHGTAHETDDNSKYIVSSWNTDDHSCTIRVFAIYQFLLGWWTCHYS